ncbi:hypothetical protein [Desulfosarcina variabilis]|uniref:hypothetical protein n=1 Tax=Desulfosarcina variabilis TaxID=2300 RepID=UPI003AFA071F
MDKYSSRAFIRFSMGESFLSGFRAIALNHRRIVGNLIIQKQPENLGTFPDLPYVRHGFFDGPNPPEFALFGKSTLSAPLQDSAELGQ